MLTGISSYPVHALHRLAGMFPTPAKRQCWLELCHVEYRYAYEAECRAGTTHMQCMRDSCTGLQGMHHASPVPGRTPADAPPQGMLLAVVHACPSTESFTSRISAASYTLLLTHHSFMHSCQDVTRCDTLFHRLWLDTLLLPRFKAHKC